MKVLIGVDGSSNSFAAVEFVGRLLSADRDELLLIFATPQVSFEDDRLDPDVEQRARTALSRAVLEAAMERLPEAWRERAQQRQVTGAPSMALLDAVEAEHADVVAVGFRGTSGIIADFVLGSVSRAVVHSAKIPVLIVKSASGTEKAAKQSPGPATQQMNVLATLDAEQFAEQTSKLLQAFTWPPETRGLLMTVVRPMFLTQLPEWVEVKRDPDVAAMADAWKQEHEQTVQAARAELEKFRTELPKCFVKHEAIVAEGRPAEEILNQIRGRAIDLAVLGSRKRSFEKLLLGSTTEQVLRESPCSVLIVR